MRNILRNVWTVRVVVLVSALAGALGTLDVARGEGGIVTLVCKAAPETGPGSMVLTIDYDRRTALDNDCPFPQAAKISDDQISWVLRVHDVKVHDMANRCRVSDYGQTATYRLDRISGRLLFEDGIVANSVLVYHCARRIF